MLKLAPTWSCTTGFGKCESPLENSEGWERHKSLWQVLQSDWKLTKPKAFDIIYPWDLKTCAFEANNDSVLRNLLTHLSNISKSWFWIRINTTWHMMSPEPFLSYESRDIWHRYNQSNVKSSEKLQIKLLPSLTKREYHHKEDIFPSTILLPTFYLDVMWRNSSRVVILGKMHSNFQQQTRGPSETREHPSQYWKLPGWALFRYLLGGIF